MFCKHKWKILSEITTKSKFETAVGAIKNAGGSCEGLPWQMSCAERKVITTVSCETCGKLKQFVNNI